MPFTPRFLPVLFGLFVAAATAFAQAPPSVAQTPPNGAGFSRLEMDARLHRQLREVLVQGVTLFNPADKGGKGDQSGCYRLFHGSLLAIVPLMDGRPELKEKIEAEIKRAEGLTSNVDRSFALRKMIEEVREAIRKDIQSAAANGKPAEKKPDGDKPAEKKPDEKPAEKTTETTATTKSLWDRLGGEPAVRTVMKEFVTVTAKNPKVDFTRSEKLTPDLSKLEDSMVRLVATVTGGPESLKYEGKGMKEAHKGMGITNEQFFAMVVDLDDVLEKQNVTTKERGELLALVLSTRKDVVEAEQLKPLTLWQRVGGEEVVAKVVKEFVAAAAADPKVDLTRGGKFKLDDEATIKLEKLLVEMISTATGGPHKYTGRSMLEAHKDMAITDEQFDAMAKHLITVLKNNKVPEKETDELMVKVLETRRDVVAPKDGDKPAEPEKKDTDKTKEGDKKDPEKPTEAEKKEDKPKDDVKPTEVEKKDAEKPKESEKKDGGEDAI